MLNLGTLSKEDWKHKVSSFPMDTRVQGETHVENTYHAIPVMMDTKCIFIDAIRNPKDRRVRHETIRNSNYVAGHISVCLKTTG